MAIVTFQMDIEVWDEQALWRAARNAAFEQLQSRPFDARSSMRNVYDALHVDGKPHLASCVQWLADPGSNDMPGTSILESRCE